MHRYSRILVGCVIGVGLSAAFLWRVPGQGVPQPVLSIQPLGTNQMQITITNGVGWANYELYGRTLLDFYPGTTIPQYPWSLVKTGAQGQVVFTHTNNFFVSFYQVSVGSDWDQDGIPNYQDAQPASTNAGALSITIDFPASNGTVP